MQTREAGISFADVAAAAVVVAAAVEIAVVVHLVTIEK